jgi:hypothetical protein
MLVNLAVIGVSSSCCAMRFVTTVGSRQSTSQRSCDDRLGHAAARREDVTWPPYFLLYNHQDEVYILTGVAPL